MKHLFKALTGLMGAGLLALAMTRGATPEAKADRKVRANLPTCLQNITYSNCYAPGTGTCAYVPAAGAAPSPISVPGQGSCCPAFIDSGLTASTGSVKGSLSTVSFGTVSVSGTISLGGSTAYAGGSIAFLRYKRAGRWNPCH